MYSLNSEITPLALPMIFDYSESAVIPIIIVFLTMGLGTMTLTPEPDVSIPMYRLVESEEQVDIYNKFTRLRNIIYDVIRKG